MMSEILNIVPYIIGGIFVVAWFLKIILYCFDQYEADFGRLGQMLMSTFMMYSEDDIEEETRKFHKNRYIGQISG